MSEYQRATGAADAPVRRAGGKGKPRGPRSLSAVVSTAATRLLNEEHKAEKKKVQGLNAAVDRASLLASGRGETLSDKLKASISAKADSIWAAKK